MKQKRLLFVALGVIAVVLANATTWRVNPNPSAKAQYKTVAEAMDDVHVQPGDTLLLDPGYYGYVDVNKKNITIIGNGYFLGWNKGWAESDETIMIDIRLYDGCTIEGCTANQIRPDGDGITIRRCKADYIGSTSNGFNNCLIEQCIVTGDLFTRTAGTVRNNIVIGSIITYRETGIIIENNTVIQNSYDRYVLNIDNGSNCIARNNILIHSDQTLNDNLMPASSYKVYPEDLTGWSMYNNVTSIAPEYKDPKYNNHDISATVETLFLNEGSDDGKWRLSENSPAKNMAINGGDCGAFGGRTPYVLSGVPQFIPHITKIEVPTRPTDGKITIKLKIENQDE